MSITEALELADESMHSLTQHLEGLSIKELHVLVKDLRFVNRLEVFTACHDFLVKKAQRFRDAIRNLEKNASGSDGLDELREHILEKTGFKIGSKTSPAEGVEKLVNEITRLRR